MMTGRWHRLNGPDICLPKAIVRLHAITKFFGNAFNLDVTCTLPAILQQLHILD